ncbi:MAG TPA: tetraacyldisaccharide 4'-kinase, partial [Paludibacter sp.]|nr:tetraacyldisaccharide 4'-kinase [Paludibacter sp.]
SLIYSSITCLRNQIYDKGILPTKRFNIPIISVGNLAVGGTGKTPHVEFILSVLQDRFRTAMLSRGYKRETSGFVMADENAKSCTIGDEPFQVYRKFPKIVVAVDEKRVSGVEKLSGLFPDIQAIVLDDAFQHRQIAAGLSIILTCYNNLYVDDCHLPGGNLRENTKGAERADILIVTKCPSDIQQNEMSEICERLKPALHQKLFFTGYEYDEIQAVFPEFCKENFTLNDIKVNKSGILLVAGIVSPEQVLEKLKEFTKTINSIFYADHHNFNDKDIKQIEEKFQQLSADKKIIIVTEKDAVRIMDNSFITNELKSKIYYLPIRVKIHDNKEEEFNKILTDYVTENSRNC